MVAKNNDILISASETLYQYNSDELIREQCQVREDFERHERTILKQIADQEAALKKQASQLQEQATKLEAYEKLLKANNIPY